MTHGRHINMEIIKKIIHGVHTEIELPESEKTLLIDL